MNKTIITLIAIMVIISAIFTAIALVKPDNIEERTQERIAEEEILDDCTDEYEQIENKNTVIANTQEEKTSPNCSITTRTYFSKCGHTKSEYANLPQELVNLTKDEIQDKYLDYEVEKFTSNEVVLFQKSEEECGEHYMVKDKEGQVAIYQILEDGELKELESTGITTEYLPETDKITMKDGIRVNGKQQLNQLIEDYE